MPTVYEKPLAAWPGRSTAWKMLIRPGTYGYLDSARYGTRTTPARGQVAGEEPSGNVFWHPNFGLVYEKPKHKPQRLDIAAFIAAWILGLPAFPLCSNEDHILFEDYCTSKAPTSQDKPQGGQSTDQNTDFEDHLDGQTQETHTSNDHLPPYANTRSHRHEDSDGGSPPPERRAAVRPFDPFGPSKTAREINEGIKRLLLGHSPAIGGYVYGFTHPEDIILMNSRTSAETTQGTHLIKIGRSVDYERRMREFQRNCRYVPRVVFAHFMPHHHRIELVVHLQLHNARLRDVGCTGCGARHAEWFRVDVEYAEHLVNLWQGFANCRSYDEQGEMLPIWRERLEELDLDDGDCWERFIREIPLDHPEAGHPQEPEECPSSPREDEVGPSSDEQSHME